MFNMYGGFWDRWTSEKITMWTPLSQAMYCHLAGNGKYSVYKYVNLPKQYQLMD